MSSNTDLIKVDHTVALTFLDKRGFKGLDNAKGSEIAKIEMGRSGIAREYTHEEDINDKK